MKRITNFEVKALSLIRENLFVCPIPPSFVGMNSGIKLIFNSPFRVGTKLKIRHNFFLVEELKLFFIIVFIFLSISNNIYSQEVSRPYIEVTGSAEMTIVPDIIELEVVLGSESESKSSVEAMEKNFFDALEAHKIPKILVSFVSVENPYYWYYWWWEYRHHNNTRTYKINLDCNQYDLSFIKDLDPENVRSIRITQSKHTKIAEYRMQIKKEAIIAARDKASYLMESIGQKAGKAFEVIEIQEPVNNNYWYGYGNQNPTSNCVMSQSSYDVPVAEANIPSIKLRFEIKAKFEII